MTRAARAASVLAFSAARRAAAHCTRIIATICRAPPFILYDRTRTLRQLKWNTRKSWRRACWSRSMWWANGQRLRAPSQPPPQ
jgi:hypothetical protein